MTDPAEALLPPRRPIARGPETAQIIAERWRRLGERTIPTSAPVFVGHRLGQADRYPVEVGPDADPAAWAELPDLLEASFGLGLTGLEIDVRVMPAGDRPYVVHDELPDADAIPEACRAYLERNDLAAVLARHVPHAAQGRRIFIELKLDRVAGTATSDPLETRWGCGEREERVFTATAAVLAGLDEATGASVGFISFSILALERIRAATGGAGSPHTTHLIATTDTPGQAEQVEKIARLDPFDARLAAEIAERPWLTGIWFDPFFFERPAATFRSLLETAGRASPLELVPSTYHSTEDDFLARFDPADRLPVAGMIFELG